MTLPPRKVVQIAATADIQFSDGEYALHRLYALCDDGSIWLSVGTTPSLTAGVTRKPRARSSRLCADAPGAGYG